MMQRATYTTTTFHYIKNWSLHTIIVDVKVFHGTTSGEAIYIYNEQAQVLAGYTTKCNLVIGMILQIPLVVWVWEFLESTCATMAWSMMHIVIIAMCVGF
jgi:hypothetical protein